MDDRTLWNQAATYWDSLQGITGSSNTAIVNQSILNLIGNVNEKRILDAGCGTGAFTRFLREENRRSRFELIGVDFSYNSVSIGQKYPNSVEQSISYSVGDLCTLPFRSAHFDISILKFVLSDVPCLEESLNEIYRVSRDGAIVVAAVIHPIAMLAAVERARRKTYKSEKPIYKAFSIQNYFAHESGFYYWTDKVRTKTYHRTVQDYVMAMLNAEIKITALLELNTKHPVGQEKVTYVPYPRFLILRGQVNK